MICYMHSTIHSQLISNNNCLHIHYSYTHYDTETMWLAIATYIATVIEMKKTSATSQWLCTGCHFVSNISYLL